MRIPLLLLALVLACGGGGKQGGTTAGHGDTKSLYDRLGGRDAIADVVDVFVANLIADPRINAVFAAADIPGFKTKVIDQICEETGGPCKYTGKTMKDAHAGMNVKPVDFDAFVDDLAKALDAVNVRAKEKAELLTALGAMKADIVTAK